MTLQAGTLPPGPSYGIRVQTPGFYLLNPKPRHSTGGSGRGGARRGSGAGRSRAGRDAYGSARQGDNCPSCLRRHRRHLSWTSRKKHEQRKSYVNRFVESKTRTYHGRVESGRMAGRRGGAGQNGTPTEHFAQETSVPRTPQGIVDTSPERPPGRTNKRNPM